MKVKIDLNRCYMSGECYYNHPELFQMGDGGFPDVLTENTDTDLKRHAQEAMEVCPASAISIEE